MPGSAEAVDRDTPVSYKKKHKPNDWSSVSVLARVVKDAKETQPGISFMKLNQVVVVSNIARNGIFSGTDLRIGDEVVKINNVACKYYSVDGVTNLIKEAWGLVTVIATRKFYAGMLVSNRSKPRTQFPTSPFSGSNHPTITPDDRSRVHRDRNEESYFYGRESREAPSSTPRFTFNVRDQHETREDPFSSSKPKTNPRPTTYPSSFLFGRKEQGEVDWHPTFNEPPRTPSARQPHYRFGESEDDMSTPIVQTKQRSAMPIFTFTFGKNREGRVSETRGLEEQRTPKRSKPKFPFAFGKKKEDWGDCPSTPKKAPKRNLLPSIRFPQRRKRETVVQSPVTNESLVRITEQTTSPCHQTLSGSSGTKNSHLTVKEVVVVKHPHPESQGERPKKRRRKRYWKRKTKESADQPPSLKEPNKGDETVVPSVVRFPSEDAHSDGMSCLSWHTEKTHTTGTSSLSTVKLIHSQQPAIPETTPVATHKNDTLLHQLFTIGCRIEDAVFGEEESEDGWS